MSTDKAHQFLHVFQKVTKLISGALDHQQVMETVVSSLPHLLDIDACTIRLLDQSTGVFVLGAAHGVSLEYLSRHNIDTRETMAMINSGVPVCSTRVDEDPSKPFREAAVREGIKSVLTLPILSRGEVIGIMRLLTRKVHEFTTEDISFSMSLAEQVGIAMGKAHLFQEMEQRVDYLREVQKMSTLVNSTLDLEDILRTIVERLRQSMRAKGCTIRLISARNNHLELVASDGLSEEYLKRGSVEAERNVRLVLSGKPVAVYDVIQDNRVHYSQEMQDEGIRSLLAVPVKVNDQVIGVLRILSSDPRIFTSDEINFAVTAAEVGGAAIQNGRTYRKINLLYEQIEEHETFLSNIINCLNQQLVVLNRQRHLVLANRAFLEHQGKGEEEVLGMHYDLICTTEGEKESCPVNRIFEQGEGATFTHQVDRNGDKIWLERTASPMVSERGDVQYVVEVIRDVTDAKKLEKEQLHRSKLEGVLEMAGAVAHEINSPLFAALGTAQLLEDDIAEPELVEELQTIIENLKKISLLTKKMATMTDFTRQDYVGETKIIEL